MKIHVQIVNQGNFKIHLIPTYVANVLRDVKYVQTQIAVQPVKREEKKWKLVWVYTIVTSNVLPNTT